VKILESGEELPDESQQDIELKERNRIDPGLRLACRVRVEGPMAVRALYW
jgi:ferredoxin